MSAKDNFPHFLEGKRIFMREVRLSDVNETYYRWMNDPEITQFLESRFVPNSMERLQEYVRNFTGNKDNILLAIVLKENHRHIGNIKLGPINWVNRFGDVGIAIGEKDCWGKGYGIEAISLVSKYAFNTLNLHKLAAGCFKSNKGSVKMFQKSGFETEGIQRQHAFRNGKYEDVIYLGLINPKDHRSP